MSMIGILASDGLFLNATVLWHGTKMTLVMNRCPEKVRLTERKKAGVIRVMVPEVL